MRLVRCLPFVVVGLACGACRLPTTKAAPPPATLPSGGATVLFVSDGDTILVSIQGVEEHVRLIGINTPETVKPNSPVECFGPESSRLAKELLPKGTLVRIERDVEARDGYNRILGYVFREPDGLFINLEMAKQGMAREMSIRPNLARQSDFRAAIADAQQARRGLWAACPST
jgi:micrococcal nuclease